LRIWPMPCILVAITKILREPSPGLWSVILIRRTLFWSGFLNAGLLMSLAAKIGPLFCKVHCVPLIGETLGYMLPISDMLMVV
jgi:hypothetical protein